MKTWQPAVVLLTLCVSSTAQVRTESARLTAADGAPNDRFGAAVALDGDLALVGAYGHGGAQPSGGAAYLYSRDLGGPGAWGLLRRIVPVDLQPSDLFGTRVALDGDVAVCSDTGRGTVHVFARNLGGADNWGEELRFVFPFTPFGPAVALQGELLAVGHAFSGRVLLYERNLGGAGHWGLRKELRFPVAGAFGSTVSLSGSTLFVTRLPLVVEHYQTGRVYVFERDQGGPNAWGAVQMIESPEVGAADMFGAAAVDGNLAVIGAYVGRGGAGAAYVYARAPAGPAPWTLARALAPTASAAVRLFGRSVALEGDVIVVGSLFDEAFSPLRSTGHVFVRHLGGPEVWGQLTRLAPENADQPGFLPQVISGGTVLGADENESSSRGAAYVFDVARAANVFRNGSGTNRACYASATPPRLGQTWIGTVDLTGHPGATATLLFAYARPAAGTRIPAGEVLVDTGSPQFLTRIGILAGTVARHVVTLPNDPALIGFACSTQAAILGGATELCNALDLVVGP